MCACLCLCVSVTVYWGEGEVDDKFAYANMVCFDVGCFSLIVKCTRLGVT